MIEDKSLDDLAVFGVPTGDLVLPENDGDKPVEIFPENAEAVAMFLRCSTQWRPSFSGAVGLDYAVLFEVMRLYGIIDQRDIFEDIQVMERAALRSLNKRDS